MGLLYVTLGSNDLPRSRRFYDAILQPLGMELKHSGDEELGYGDAALAAGDRPIQLWLVKPVLPLPATWGNGTMFALAAQSRDVVRQFHAVGLAHGGLDEGAPGLRPYHKTFYAAYLRDPDGNKLSAVCERVE